MSKIWISVLCAAWERVLVMSDIQMKTRELVMLQCVALPVDVSATLVLKETALLQPHLPTQLVLLTFFVPSWRVHLDLQTLWMPFSFHWLFAFLSYLIQPLFLPRSQIKQLGTLASLPSYWSAKIKQFGQISFSILQHKFKTWHDPD